MIQWIEHSNIDKVKWNQCISRSSNECIFVYSWYLDVVCKEWKALVLNDYEAVFPIAIKSRYNIEYLYQPFFMRYFGVFSNTLPSDELVREFLSIISSTYKQLQFCLHESNSIALKNSLITNRQFQYLDISSTHEKLYKGYSGNVKRGLKKTAKLNLQVVRGIAPEEIVELFKKTKGSKLEVFRPEHYQMLIHLMNCCVANNKGESIAVYNGKELYAAAFFMQSNNRFVCLKSGVTDEGKKNRALHFLIDRFIQMHAGEKNTLDFGGSSIESVAHFNRSFGAKDCVYLQLEKGILFKLIKWIKLFKP